MIQKFYKYQGAGNDFIVFDNREGSFPQNDTELIHRLCDRRFGIGADGLMLLQDAPGYDFEMLYFNADGREGSMCGNGGRCIAAFAHHLGLFTEKTVFLAVDGPHTAYLSAMDGAEKEIRLQMIDVSRVDSGEGDYVLDTGSPHYVRIVRELDRLPVFDEGRSIRYSPRFAESGGINVNFVEPHPDGDGYLIRTYERGVEDETLACGTGATAAAIAMALHQGTEGHIRTSVHTRGGRLHIQFHRQGQQFTEVYLEGPATLVFEGIIVW